MDPMTALLFGLGHGMFNMDKGGLNELMQHLIQRGMGQGGLMGALTPHNGLTQHGGTGSPLVGGMVGGMQGHGGLAPTMGALLGLGMH